MSRTILGACVRHTQRPRTLATIAVAASVGLSVAVTGTARAASRSPDTRAVATLKITSVTKRVVYGRAILVRGVLRSGAAGLAGQQVALLYRATGSRGAFTVFATTARTRSGGIVSFSSFRPTTPVEVELKFAGTSTYRAATSARVEVAEEMRLALRAAVESMGPLRARRDVVKFTGA